MTRARTWITLAVLTAALLVRAAGAADFEEKRFYLTPFVGWTFFDNERLFSSGQKLTDDVYFGGRAGVRLVSPLWLDLAGGYTGTKDCAECTESLTHYSANLLLSSATVRTFNPFVSLGGGWSTYRPASGEFRNATTFEAAGGVRVRLNDALGIRLEARNLLELSKEGWSKSHVDDIVVGAGLTFAFGGAGEEKVVDLDSDGDGVPDSRDDCPNTPRGCKVDARGCPIDSDGDGVCDGLDQCPDTPRGCRVDSRGCPIDSDGDGVCDGLDRCANTPAGAKVDRDGCPIVERELQLETELLDTGKLVLSDVNFDYDKSTIRPEAHAVLETVGRVLTKWPGLRIEIGGHTDWRGSDAYNRRLSDRRAAAVRAYLLEHFPQFAPDQITSKGYGESKPMVPNTSAANMQLNRRVEFVVINREMLKRQP